MNKKIFTGLAAVLFYFSACFAVNLFADAPRHTISGTVTNEADGSPLKDVDITVSAGEEDFFDKTDVFGFYQIESIDAGLYVEVSAVKEGFVISPDILKVPTLNSDRTINFTASPARENRQTSRQQDVPVIPKPDPVVVSASGMPQDTPALPKQTPTVVPVSKMSQDTPVLPKPVSGVTQKQPEYVTEVKPFFASDSGASKDVSASPKPVRGVTQKQPEHISETRPLFASAETSKTAAQKNDAPAKTSFDLNGKVIYYASGLVGVRVMINNDRRLMAATDVNGNFSFKNLKAGQDYIVSFSRDGYAFSPSEYKIIYDNRDVFINVEASASRYKIHGRVVDGKYGVEGVDIKIISGVDEFSAYTDNEGTFVIEDLPHGNNYFITASKEGVAITPSRVVVNKLDNDRAVNFTAAVQKFSISGTVTDFNGDILKNAEIEIKTTFDTVKTVTNTKGKYIFENMPMALTYTLTAGKEGFVSSLPFVIEMLDRNREINFQIKQSAKKEKESMPAKKDEISEPKKVTAVKEAKETGAPSGRNRRNIRQKNNDESDVKEEAAKPVLTIVPKEEKKSKADEEAAKRKAETDKLLAQRQAEADERARIAAEKKAEEDAERVRQADERKAAAEKAKAEEDERARIAAEKKAEEDAERVRQADERKAAAEKAKAEADERARIAAEKKAEEDAEKARLAEEKKAAAEKAKTKKPTRRQVGSKISEEKIAKAEAEKAEKQAAAELKAKQAAELKASRQEAEQTQKEKSSSKPDKKESSVKEEIPAAVLSAKSEKTSSERERTVKVKGKIESVSGEGLKDIEVTMSGGFSVRTDDRGRYEIAVPAGSKYTLKPLASNFYFEPGEVVYDELKTNTVQDFMPHIAIEGEVFAGVQPVADVPISVNGVQTAVTNQFGRYRIEKIQYGSRVLISAAKTGITFFPGSVEIAKAVENLENANFIVSYSISGKVSMQVSGVGLSNIKVEVTGKDISAVTDFSGNFVISGMSQGDSFEITPQAGGFTFTPPSRKFTDLRESIVGQNFSAIKETYTVTGNVNVGGKPVRNAVITISKRALKYYTDDDGNFKITNLDYGGPYTLTVISREHQFEPIAIDFLDRDITVQFSNDISLGGTVVSGRRPVPGVTVDVNGRKYKTDENGRYLITGLKYNGNYLLSLSAQGIIFTPPQKEYTEITKSVLDEVFNAAAVIGGRVTFNGKPFVWAIIDLNGDSVAKSDLNGYFLIQDLQLGKDYTLEISSPGYKFDHPKREYKNLDSGKLSENFKAMVSGLSIKGVVTAEGRPLRRVSVVIEGTSKSQTTTDDNGAFSFEGLAANKRYEITVLSKNHKFETPSAIIENLGSDKKINLQSGKTATVVSTGEAKVSKAASEAAAKTKFKVSGKVTADGNPLKDAVMKNKFGDAVTNAAGEYTITVEAGNTIEVQPFLAGYVFSPEKLVVENIKASASNMNFNARLNSYALSGQILNKDLKGVKGISIKDINSDYDFMTDAKGAYKITGMPHKKNVIISPDSETYDFYPENLAFALESDLTANDIYAYPKKVKKSEAFIYGGVNSAIHIKENYVTIAMVPAESGKVSVKIRDNKGSVIKEFETKLSVNTLTDIHWDGLTGKGAEVPKGNYSVLIDGAGFKGEVLNFKVV